jgi:hypothetical protein
MESGEVTVWFEDGYSGTAKVEQLTREGGFVGASPSPTGKKLVLSTPHHSVQIEGLLVRAVVDKEFLANYSEKFQYDAADSIAITRKTADSKYLENCLYAIIDFLQSSKQDASLVLLADEGLNATHKLLTCLKKIRKKSE